MTLEESNIELLMPVLGYAWAARWVHAELVFSNGGVEPRVSDSEPQGTIMVNAYDTQGPGEFSVEFYSPITQADVRKVGNLLLLHGLYQPEDFLSIKALIK